MLNTILTTFFLYLFFGEEAGQADLHHTIRLISLYSDAVSLKFKVFISFTSFRRSGINYFIKSNPLYKQYVINNYHSYIHYKLLNECVKLCDLNECVKKAP